jgi:hypothetical protein
MLHLEVVDAGLTRIKKKELATVYTNEKATSHQNCAVLKLG